MNNTIQEIWKEIPGSLHYAISNQGKIKRLEHKKWNKNNNSYSLFKEKYLSVSFNNTKKYGRIAVYYKDGTKKVESIHRLVASCFLPNPYNLPQVNHIDGNKTNNYVSNLEWCTGKENMQHRINILKVKPWKNGSECNFHKLTEKEIYEIADLIKKGVRKNKIAKMYSVVPSTITELSSGRSWKHLNLF